ncbi:TolC family protein [Pseudomonas sp. dw_358]|uniref:efflux transporter outer membrane subunit n=1 Tax=Pseudomonas sp. dw_358 TaxID=2720083 RepID=UPI001BD3FDD2|nr:TolC family protein [Pseudomonas sp. dw_358]
MALLYGCQGLLPPSDSLPSVIGDPFGTLPGGVSTAPVPTHWWVLYRDPVLDRLVDHALHNNQDLAKADAHVQALIAGISEQRADLRPQTQVELSALYGKTDDDQTLGKATDRHTPSQLEWGPSLGLDYQLDIGGQVHAAIAQAEASASAVEAARDQARLNVAVQTTRAYIDLCSYGARLDVSRQSLRLLNESLALSERQREGGVVTELDVSRLRSLAFQTQSELPWLEARQHMARYELALLIGEGPDASAGNIQCRTIPQLAADLPSGDAWQLLHRRPDIRQAERELQASEWAVKVVHADLYPKVILGVSLSSSSNTLGHLGESHAVMFGLGPLISWQFPNMSANRARISKAQADSRGELAAWRGSVLAAMKDTRQALAALGGERQRRQNLDEALKESTKAYELAEKNYQAGALDGLQRLDAERDLITVQARQIEARQRQAYSETAVFRALGGGWETQTADTATRKSP